VALEMRNISFSLTSEQVRQRIKTVTRRQGWLWLVAAMNRNEEVLLQPIVKGQGLKRGQHVEKIGGPIRVVSARREPLCCMTAHQVYGWSECLLEGFFGTSPQQFVKMYAEHNGCAKDSPVTRIGFVYL
jgi:hypothetical protein